MAQSKRTLLISEDELDLREILVEICSQVTTDIRVASNGQEAFEILMQGEIDAVLSDINMPGMTGLEVLHKIRANGLDTPFIIISGYIEKSNVLQALKAGANDFLNKPFENQTVLATLEEALELGAALRDLDRQISEKYQKLNIPCEEIETQKKARTHVWALENHLSRTEPGDIPK